MRSLDAGLSLASGLILTCLLAPVSECATAAVSPADSLRRLPVRDYREIASLSPGVLTRGVYRSDIESMSGPTLYIRGGRSYSADWRLGGFSLRDPFTGLCSVPIGVNALRDVGLRAGTLGADEGHAGSGIVDLELRTPETRRLGGL